MKKLLILVITIWSTSTFGQTPTTKSREHVIKLNKELDSDTILKVVYANEGEQQNKPAFFINGKFVNETLLGTLNPSQIESLNIVKDSIQIDNVQYHGQILIKTKSSFTPKLISLTDLKEKYTNLKSKAVVFMIDGEIINADYDKYLVDESYLLKIIVDKIEILKENIDLGLIKLLTKSDENIEKSKEIRIRGMEVSLAK